MHKTRQLTIAIAMALLMTTLSHGQGALASGHLESFHVRGTITDQMRAVVPGTTVLFRSDDVSRVVSVNNSGFYETDLPFGTYSMTAQAPPRYRLYGEYSRPIFRVTSPLSIVLNGTLPTGSHSCDISWDRSAPPQDPDELQDAVKNLCGGEDNFATTPQNGSSFKIYIRYSQRRPFNNGGYAYSSHRLGPTSTPVFVAYNLFSLQAKEVTYDPQDGVLAAQGDVVVADASGKEQRFESARFRMEAGEAIRGKE
jgi:hypothetical protein